MMLKWIIYLPLFLALSGCSMLTHFSNDKAAGYRQFSREECVPYARRMSGIQLRGDAHTWWNKAAGVYVRGQQPRPNAVLVLARSSRLRHGHLAVVTQQIGPRDIDVTHRNWGNDWLSRRVTYEKLRVQDVSDQNDWTRVRMWNNEVSNFGSPYPAYGFIYNIRE